MTSRSYLQLGTALWTLAAIFALLPSWPYIYYRLTPTASEALATTISDTVRFEAPKPTQKPTETPKAPIVPEEKPVDLPELDPSLPKENGLIIDKIGVRGQIHEGEDWQNILKKGIWRAPGVATPTSDNQMPIILAAHRWGYLDWSSSFRKLNSFYNLPKLAVGDTIKIIWEQREYEYKVYAVTTGTAIPEYNANLILYTCQLWNSPLRFFVLANRVN